MVGRILATRFRRGLVLLAALLTLSAAIVAVRAVTAEADAVGPAVAGAATAEIVAHRGAVDDVSLAARVQQAIDAYPAYDMFDWVECRADAGTIVLRGTVAEPWRATEYAAFVRVLPGVRGVRNELGVLTTNERDARLRSAAARALDGLRVGPASRVHVLVEGGVVQLKGIVASELEREMITDRVGIAVAPVAVRSDVRTGGLARFPR